MSEFITRAYNTIEFNKSKGTILKKSKEKRLFNETQHYKCLPEKIKIWFPRVISSGRENEEYFLELEAYGYKNLGEHLLAKTLTDEDWVEVSEILLNTIKEFISCKKSTDLYKNMNLMYKDKTITEYNNLKNTSIYFKDLCSKEKIIINDKEYNNFETLWRENLNEWILLFSQSAESTFFHGDLCFSNILFGRINKNNQIIKLLDPRGLFGKQYAFGDIYYDLAKLMHSTDGGYEYFITDNFSAIEEEENNFTLSYSNHNKEKIHQIFNEKIYSKFNIKKIKLIQGLIYIGMCARHYDNSRRQLAMYLSGIKILNTINE